MPKSTAICWNPRAPESREHWKPISGLAGLVEELTLSIDLETGECAQLTRFLPEANTSSFGWKSHSYPEEMLLVGGRPFARHLETTLQRHCHLYRSAHPPEESWPCHPHRQAREALPDQAQTLSIKIHQSSGTRQVIHDSAKIYSHIFKKRTR